MIHQKKKKTHAQIEKSNEPINESTDSDKGDRNEKR